MEIALMRRDEEGQEALDDGPRSQPASPSPSKKQQHGNIILYCATHHHTLTIHLLPHPLPPSASRHHVLRLRSPRFSYSVFWPANAIERPAWTTS
jgi:hypothetical protein